MLKARKVISLIVAVLFIFSVTIAVSGCGKTVEKVAESTTTGSVKQEPAETTKEAAPEPPKPIKLKWYGGSFGVDISKVIETSDVWQKINRIQELHWRSNQLK